jgi:hypothetical protein
MSVRICFPLWSDKVMIVLRDTAECQGCDVVSAFFNTPSKCRARGTDRRHSETNLADDRVICVFFVSVSEWQAIQVLTYLIDATLSSVNLMTLSGQKER